MTSLLPSRLLPLAAVALLCAATARAEDHRDYKDASPQDCRDCHRSSGVAENHGANFLRDHRLLAQKSNNNCAACHETSFCVDCHNGGNLERDPRSSLSRRGEAMPRTHAADFLSTHSIVAREEARSCTRCHDTARFCGDCHARRRQQQGSSYDISRHAPTYGAGGALDPAWVAYHRSEARRNLQSCQSCHQQKSDCSNYACHSNLGGR